MRCPHCDEEIGGPKCPECGAMMPESASYCMDCGFPMNENSEEDIVTDGDEHDFDFDNRVLCPDGACTGIIIEGKCVECGKKI
jgi:predicted amidophosphoribosyltransferase